MNKKKISRSLVNLLKSYKPKFRKFTPHVWWDKKNGLIEVCLEDVSSFSEWIEGDCSLQSVNRAIDDKRVIGATLSYAGKELKFFKK